MTPATPFVVVVGTRAPVVTAAEAILREAGCTVRSVDPAGASSTGLLGDADIVVICATQEPWGAELTADIMSSDPRPTIVVAPGEAREAASAMLRAGALEVLTLPAAPNDPAFGRALARTVRLVNGLPLVRRRSVQPAAPGVRPATATTPLIAIAASTGGPQALITVLRGLGRSLPCPVAIVQHMPAPFMRSFADWLAGDAGVQVVIATSGDRLDAGKVYLAPGELHLEIRRGGVAALSDAEPSQSCRPSADVLFQSVAASYGRKAIGVLLTGMGEDGARGLMAIRQAGGLTVAQDQASSAVFGMPRAGAALGGARLVLPLTEIPAAILNHLRNLSAERTS